MSAFTQAMADLLYSAIGHLHDDRYLREAFPVGSVFIGVVSTNPQTLLGYGTWIEFGAGRVMVGFDSAQTEFDVVEETGGSKTHILTSGEMPSHTHAQDSHNHTQDAHSHNYDTRASSTAGGQPYVMRSSTVGTIGPLVTAAVAATNQAAIANNQNTGGGGAHNNLQPYIVVYMWKRTL